MITINLIPTNKKEEIRLSEVDIVIKNLIISLLLFIITVAIILLVSKMILQNTFNRIVADTTLTTRYGNIFSNDIKIFNQRLRAVEKIQKKYIPWTNFIFSFVNLVPEDISIATLNLEAEAKNEEDNNTVTISGTAKTREKLLQFKANLENSALFSSIDIPLENLLKKEGVNFNIKAKFNL